MKQGNYCPEYLQDCFAREMMKPKSEVARLWAAKQNEATKEAMRERMKRIKVEKRAQ